jgi:hypothetical protein
VLTVGDVAIDVVVELAELSEEGELHGGDKRYGSVFHANMGKCFFSMAKRGCNFWIQLAKRQMEYSGKHKSWPHGG